MATLKGTWRFNEVLSEPSNDIIQLIDFVLEDDVPWAKSVYCIEVHKSSVDSTDGSMGLYFSAGDGGLTVYRDSVWVSPYDYDTSWARLGTIPTAIEVSDEFYEWFTANAIRIDEEQTPIATITYKGETLETLNGGEYVTLHTKGQMMEDDIRVDVAEGSGGGDIAINGIVEQYKVNAGATVNAGDFVEFVNKFGGGTISETAPSYIATCKLDNNRVLVICDRTAVVLSVGQAGVTMGEKFDFGYTVYNPHLAALSGGRVLLCGGMPSDLNAVVLSIDGTTIKPGTPLRLAANDMNTTKILVFAENRALLLCKSFVILVNVQGETISGFTTFTDLVDNVHDGEVLSENRVILACGGAYIDLYVATISGNQITYGAMYQALTSATVDWCSVAVLNENEFILAFGMHRSSEGHTTRCLRFQVTNGTSAFLSTYSVGYASDVGDIQSLTETTALLVFRDIEGSGYGKARVISLTDAGGLNGGDVITFDYNNISKINLAVLSPASSFAVVNDGIARYITLSTDGTTITTDSAEIGTYVQPATSRLHNVGVAKTSGAEGQTVDVYCV